MGFQKNQVGVVEWHGLELRVTADFNDNGQPVSLSRVMVVDMPQEFHEAFTAWLRDERIIKVTVPPVGNGYYLDDIEEFLAWQKGQAVDWD